MNSRQFYRSSSGDTWNLVTDDGHIAVLHTPNLASGGRVERYDIATFLAQEPHTAQNVALRGLIGGLIEQQPADAAA